MSNFRSVELKSIRQFPQDVRDWLRGVSPVPDQVVYVPADPRPRITAWIGALFSGVVLSAAICAIAFFFYVAILKVHREISGQALVSAIVLILMVAVFAAVANNAFERLKFYLQILFGRHRFGVFSLESALLVRDSYAKCMVVPRSSIQKVAVQEFEGSDRFWVWLILGNGYQQLLFSGDGVENSDRIQLQEWCAPDVNCTLMSVDIRPQESGVSPARGSGSDRPYEGLRKNWLIGWKEIFEGVSPLPEGTRFFAEQDPQDRYPFSPVPVILLLFLVVTIFILTDQVLSPESNWQRRAGIGFLGVILSGLACLVVYFWIRTLLEWSFRTFTPHRFGIFISEREFVLRRDVNSAIFVPIAAIDGGELRGTNSKWQLHIHFNAVLPAGGASSLSFDSENLGSVNLSNLRAAMPVPIRDLREQ